MKEVMNPFNTGIFSLEIISHKLLRWFAPVFLICLVTSSILLAIHGNIFFQGLALGMGAGLLLSMIGYFMRGKTQLPSYFFLPYYFLTVNYASLVGIIRSLRGDIQITWDTVRSPEDISRYRNKSVHYFFFGSIIVTTLILIISAQADIPLFPVQLLLWSGFLTICYTYFGYPATLFCWSKINTVSLSKGPITPSVTLLICAYNEEQVIEQKIINSFEITYPSEKLTIAIASDGSSDRTNEIVSRYENENLLFFNFPERQGKIGVINAVVPQLDTEIIIFSDANTMYAPDAINKLVRNFNDPKVGAVSADVILHNEKTSFGQSESLYYTYERWIQQKETEIWSIIGADGGMYAIRRELFTAPSPNIILDDFVISMNVALGGHRVVYEPEAFGYEKGTVSHRIEFLRKSRVIAGAIQSVKQCEGVPSTSQIILLFCYLSHKFLRWMVPLLLVLIFLLNFHLALNFPGVLYKVTAALQLSFYLSAAFGYFLRDIQFTSILAVPFYFCLENGAALYGIYKGLFNKQPVTWKKFDRMK
jgi:cellulose synthase/poly-beta-1,6-N-acetylglucosamine synthase-like glycosyltransferase